MSQTIYLRDPQTGALTELIDPKPAELVPLLAKGFRQVSEPEQPHSPLTPAAQPEQKKES